MPPAFTFVDLFAGCGGFSLGLSDVGGTGLIAIEKSESAFDSLARNLGPKGHKPTFVWPSWFNVEAAEIGSFWHRHSADLKRMRGTVDVLAGGPPCQGFSTYGRRNRDDERNGLYLDYLRVVEAIQPTVVLLENVQGIDMPFIVSGQKTGKHCRKTVAARIEEKLTALGYQTHVLKLCASNFGVPQRRIRFIMLAVRTTRGLFDKKIFSDEFFSAVRHEHLARFGLREASRVTSSQALSDLECARTTLIPCVDAARRFQVEYLGPKTQYQRQMRLNMSKSAQPSSMRLARHSDAVIAKFELIQRLVEPDMPVGESVRAQLKSAKFRTYLLSKATPSATVTTLPDDLVHYSEPRILSVRECARLQSFPDWFDFSGPYTTGGERRRLEVPRYSQVGNAVPPRLGSFLGAYAKAILKHLEHPNSLSLAA